MKRKIRHLFYNILNIFFKIMFFFYVFVFDVYSIFRFIFHKISKNTVLIVEPNSYHGVIIPGYVKYFQDLGYNVELFVRHQQKFNNPFCVYNKSSLPKFFVMSLFLMKILFKFKKIKDYKIIFFSTSSVWKKQNIISIVDIFSLDKIKDKVFCVEHDIGYFNINNMDNLSYLKYFCDKGRVFTLSDYKNFPSLLPCYFGDIKTDKKLLPKKVFINCGTALPYVRNNDILIKAVDRLVKNGFTNFEVVIIAQRGEVIIPKELKPYIKFMGKVSYYKLFKEMKKADFFLACLDPFTNKHRKYLNGTTTGSKILVCSFNTPIVVSKIFADAIGFNDKNSIVYKDNDLYDAMLKCLTMQNEEYVKICENLRELSDDFYKKSYCNLKDRLENE